MRETPETWQLVKPAMMEVVAVAQAEGVALDEGAVDRALAEAEEKMPGTWRGSLVLDLEAGNRLEVDWLHGTICRLGQKHGIETPFHHFVHGALMPSAAGR